MRKIMLAVAVSALVPTAAIAQPTPAPTATAAAAYSTSDTDIGTLLANPATKAVLVKYVPTLVSNSQISMASGMTLKAVQGYAADLLSDETLAKIDAELAKIPMAK